MKRTLAAACMLAASLAAGTAFAGASADPGLTSTTILIGGTAPISGEASSAAAVARGAEAYFKYVNDRGGVNGRKITYSYLDDGYQSDRTVQVVRQLVQQEQVFAIFNTLGTNNNLAVRDFLNQSQVPQLFVASGANTWGADWRKYPWTIGFIPSYKAEARLLARTLVKARPRAKVAVLFQDDEYGQELAAGLERALARTSARVVAKAGYAPTATDVSSEVAALKVSGANTFMVFAFGKFAVQAMIHAARLGWRPQVYVNAVASSANLMTLADLAGAKAVTTGATSIVFGKDPSDPRWSKDTGIALSRRILRRYVRGANPKDGYYIAGMAVAYTLVDTLRKAGRSPTRASVMKAALSLNERANPFLLPGMVVKTSPTDHFPLEQAALQRWSKGHWSIVSPLQPAKP